MAAMSFKSVKAYFYHDGDMTNLYGALFSTITVMASITAAVGTLGVIPSVLPGFIVSARLLVSFLIGVSIYSVSDHRGNVKLKHFLVVMSLLVLLLCFSSTLGYLNPDNIPSAPSPIEILLLPIIAPYGSIGSLVPLFGELCLYGMALIYILQSKMTRRYLAILLGLGAATTALSIAGFLAIVEPAGSMSVVAFFFSLVCYYTSIVAMAKIDTCSKMSVAYIEGELRRLQPRRIPLRAHR